MKPQGTSAIECDGGPNCMAAEHLHGCFAERRRPQPTRDELEAAVKRYLQLDGSHGCYDALELGIARRRLIELVGEVKPLTLKDLVAERRAT